MLPNGRWCRLRKIDRRGLHSPNEGRVKIVCFADRNSRPEDFLMEALHVFSDFGKDVRPHEHAIFCSSKEISGLIIAGDTAFAEHSEKWHPAMRNLADTPSTSIKGIVAKLRILATSMMGDQNSDYNEDILLLAIADLERLSENDL